MISGRWLSKRQSHWTKLEALLDASEQRGIGVLTHQALRELGLLYRQTAADLSFVRETPGEGRLALYLNQLLSRAHNVMYSVRARDPRGILRFYFQVFPGVFRDTLPYTLFAAVLFAGAAMVGALTTLADPFFPQRLLGPEMIDTIERRQMWTSSILAVKPVASSGIMTNNMMVTFAAAALGITAGVGTMFMMVLNGLMIGVIATACAQAQMSTALWSFVAPHGVLELPAIFIGGGSGLVLARGLLFPGLSRRGAALREAGGTAVRLVLGTIPLLVVAGIVEAFLSPTSVPSALKFTFAGILALVLVLYLAKPADNQSSPRSLISRY